jgi:hypothetical protein
MLVTSRLAGLSALEAYYAGGRNGRAISPCGKGGASTSARRATASRLCARRVASGLTGMKKQSPNFLR